MKDYVVTENWIFPSIQLGVRRKRECHMDGEGWLDA